MSSKEQLNSTREAAWSEWDGQGNRKATSGSQQMCREAAVPVWCDISLIMAFCGATVMLKTQHPGWGQGLQLEQRCSSTSNNEGRVFVLLCLWHFMSSSSSFALFCCSISEQGVLSVVREVKSLFYFPFLTVNHCWRWKRWLGKGTSTFLTLSEVFTWAHPLTSSLRCYLPLALL